MHITTRVKLRQQQSGPRFRGQLYIDGRFIRSKVFPTRAEAQQWANDQAAFARAGKVQGVGSKLASRTLADLCDTYLKKDLPSIALGNQAQRRADVEG